jgi:hypothetical protein
MQTGHKRYRKRGMQVGMRDKDRERGMQAGHKR